VEPLLTNSGSDLDMSCELGHRRSWIYATWQMYRRPNGRSFLPSPEGSAQLRSRFKHRDSRTTNDRKEAMSSSVNEVAYYAAEYFGERRQVRKDVGFLAGRRGARIDEGVSRASFTDLYRRLSEVGAWLGLAESLKIGPSGRSGEFKTRDGYALLDTLLATGRFCVDTRAGKILHPGAQALRELSNRESLHVAVYGNRVRAHLDRFSPLTGRKPNKGHCRYSLPQVAAHVTGRLGARLVRELKGGWVKLDVACSWMRMPQRNSEPRPQALEP